MNLNQFLASPLVKLLNYFDQNNLEYSLNEIKPPLKNQENLEMKRTKRVLKISENDNKFIITWSFQYIS